MEGGSGNVAFNEIEMVDNIYIYANNFLTSDIYKFSKVNGSLIAVWNLAELLDI